MAVTFGTFTPGSVMAASNLVVNADAAAAYLQGGVVTGDIPNGSIRTPAIFRPDWYGYPLEGYYGVSQSGHGRWTDQSSKFIESDSRIEFMTFNIESGDTLYPCMWWAASLDLPESALVRVYADGQVAGFCNFSDSAHYMAKVGELVLCYRDRATRTVTEVTMSRRDVYAGGSTGAYFMDHMNLMMLETLAAGSYDFFVAVRKPSGGTVSADTRCISFGTRTMSVRAFRAQ